MEISEEENKLLKNYQFLTQYMLHSIKELKMKNAILTSLTNKQKVQNNMADQYLKQQVLII